MNTPAPKIAIIIPAYKAAAFLAETLGSVLAQTYPPADIIVVDDGSPDNVAEIASSFGPRVTVIRQKNIGMSGSRIRGMNATQAELVLFLDADDMLLPDALKLLSAALCAKPGAVLAAGAAQLWTPGAPNPIQPDTELNWPGEKHFWRDLLSGNCIRTSGCVLVRRTVLAAAGNWDTNMKVQGAEDWDMWLRMAEHGPFAQVTEPVMKYRRHPNSFSTTQHRKMSRSAFVMLAKQRVRWRPDPGRSAAIADAEWNLAVNVARGTLRYARAKIAQKDFAEALGALAEAAWLGARPLGVRIMTFPRRHLMRKGTSGI